MAKFKADEIRVGLVFKFEGQFFKITDLPTKITVFGENLCNGLPKSVKVPMDRLKRPSAEELAQLGIQ